MISSAEWLQDPNSLEALLQLKKECLTTDITKGTELRMMVGKALPVQELHCTSKGRVSKTKK